jgi:hypothetical protein
VPEGSFNSIRKVSHQTDVKDNSASNYTIGKFNYQTLGRYYE